MKSILIAYFLKFLAGALSLTSPSGRRQGDWRGDKGTKFAAGAPTYYSRNKDMSIDSNSVGMSWFPGYAYDVETGERLNIFFGENALYNGSIINEALNPGSSTGNDMIFNPTSTYRTETGSIDESVNFLSHVLGGQHIVYVTRQKYDSCQALIDKINTFFLFDSDNLIIPSMDITWASMAVLSEGAKMQGQFGQLPPTDMTVKLRVNKPHEIEIGTNSNLGYPLYEFSLDGLAPEKENEEAVPVLINEPVDDTEEVADEESESEESDEEEQVIVKKDKGLIEKFFDWLLNIF